MILKGCWLVTRWAPWANMSKYEQPEIATRITAKLLHLLHVQQHSRRGDKRQYFKYWVDSWNNCDMIFISLANWFHLKNRAFSRQFFTQKFWVKSESTPVFLSKILSLSQTNCVNLRHICFKNYQNSKMYPNITWCKRPITVNGKRRVNVFFREKLGWSAFLSFYYWIVSELISYRNGSSLASFAFFSSCFFFLFLVASSSFFPPVLSSTCLRFSFFWSWEFSFFFFWASFSSAAFFSMFLIWF